MGVAFTKGVFGLADAHTNTTAVGIIDDSIRQRRSKAMDISNKGSSSSIDGLAVQIAVITSPNISPARHRIIRIIIMNLLQPQDLKQSSLRRQLPQFLACYGHHGHAFKTKFAPQTTSALSCLLWASWPRSSCPAPGWIFHQPAVAGSHGNAFHQQVCCNCIFFWAAHCSLMRSA
jgi:hypothetical protein